MFYTTNILAAPLILLAWMLDLYVFLAGLRLLLTRLEATRNSKFCLAICQIVDPMPLRVSNWLSVKRASTPSKLIL